MPQGTCALENLLPIFLSPPYDGALWVGHPEPSLGPAQTLCFSLQNALNLLSHVWGN